MEIKAICFSKVVKAGDSFLRIVSRAVNVIHARGSYLEVSYLNKVVH